MAASKINLSTLQFDLFGRYATLRDCVNTFRTKPSYKILEVGGFKSPLRNFLPHDKITLLDILPSKEGGYIQGDGCKLPFLDNSFDIVLSTDTLEHILAKKRLKFLEEHSRVARDFIIISAPFLTPFIQQQEKEVNTYYHILANKEHPWLKEHLIHGLPENNLVENFLKKHQIEYLKTHHANLALWPILNRFLFFVSSNYSDLVQKEFKSFNQFYNQEIYPYDHQKDSYRTIYLGKMKKELILPPVKFFKEPLSSEKQEQIKNKIFNIIAAANKETLLANQNLKQSANQSAQSKKEAEANALRMGFYLKEIDEQLGEASLAKEELVLTRQHVRNLETELQKIKNSFLWKIMDWLKKPKMLFRSLKYLAQQRTALWLNLKITWKEGRIRGVILKIFRFFAWLHSGPSDLINKNLERAQQYQEWLKINQLTPYRQREMLSEIKEFHYSPIVSLLVPVYNTEKKYLKKMIQSVLNQIYPNFELCLVDDSSSNPEIKQFLEEISRRDKRIKTAFHSQNQGIVATTNTALFLATGEFIGLLDHDDLLTPDCLFEAVKLLNKEPQADLIYSDEDKIDQNEQRSEPYFKPEWSPDLLLSQMYIGHFTIYRKKIVDKLNGFRPGFDGSQDYDLALRVTEITSQIQHIPKILYHWRKTAQSTAAWAYQKPYTIIRSLRALNEALKRRKIKGEALPGLAYGIFRIQYQFEKEPLVSIIIPTKDRLPYLSRCLSSILSLTDYGNYEILIANNQSEGEETMKYLKEIQKIRNVRVVDFNQPFNFSGINNFAAAKARGEFLLFLNNDTQVINRNWLSALLEHGLRKEVGAVGAKLLYPNDTIQHAGVILGIGGSNTYNGVAGHAEKYCPDGMDGYYRQKDLIRNYSAVTAGCLLISKKLFQKIGGFDEKLRVAFNDVDLCLRLRKQGYLIVYTPYAKLYHYESVSVGRPENGIRNQEELWQEARLVHQRWGKILQNDPYYNPNLSRTKEDFSLNI